jgi:putative oxidoreductase
MKPDFGLLLLRLTFGLMIMSHGLGKVQALIAGKTAFADPIGIGEAPSLALAAFAEFLCALAVVLGFKTRWAAIPVVVTMLVAVFIVHAGDGWEKQEFPLLYASAFLALVFTGGGRYAVDAWLSKRRRRR